MNEKRVTFYTKCVIIAFGSYYKIISDKIISHNYLSNVA